MIKPGLYQHFKGQMYRVFTTAEHSETGEIVVVYMALYGDCKFYVRPLSMFTEVVSNPEGGIELLRFMYKGR